MKRGVVFLLWCVCMVNAHAQKSRNELQVRGTLVIPHDHYAGYGMDIKWLHSVGRSGQFTLSAGKYRVKSSSMVNGARLLWLRTVPFMAGYRHTMHRFYIEPQAGFGEIGGRVDLQGGYSKPSYGAFFWGVEGGVKLKRFDIGLRYQNANKAKHPLRPIDLDMLIHKLQYVGIYAGYNLLRLRHKKK